MARAALCGLLMTLFGYLGAARAQDLKIEHVTIVSPERADAIRDASVTIHEGRIAAISSDSRAKSAPMPHSNALRLDGRGLYLVPGLIDSHVHLGGVPGMTEEQEKAYPDIAREARDQVPRSFLQFGFTTLIDLISTPEAVTRWKYHDLVPDTYFCGGAALMDGYPMNYAPESSRYQNWPYMIIEAGSTAELPSGTQTMDHTPLAVVARMKADGAICVKTFFDRGADPKTSLPVPRLETIQALVRAAHEAGLPVLLHASSTEAHVFGLDAGVDDMAHGLWNWGPDPSSGDLAPAVEAVLDREIQSQVGWQPTFRVGLGFRDLLLPSFLSHPTLRRVLPQRLIEWYRTSDGQQFHDQMASGLSLAPNHDPKALDAQVSAIYANVFGKLARSTRYLAHHGGRLLFGTDTPCAPLYSNPPGLNGWWEIQSMQNAGVTPAQIFMAATLANAWALKLDREIGTVQVGKRANLLLLRADPRKTIQAYAGIVKVFLGGRVLDPGELAADHPP